MYYFCLHTHRFLSSAVECGKRSPELIQLLDMHMHFSSATPGIRVSTCQVAGNYSVYIYCKSLSQGGAGNALKPPVTKCDSGTQTDTHFMETNIVKSYEWNEWELRRKAIKLVTQIQLAFSSVGGYY